MEKLCSQVYLGLDGHKTLVKGEVGLVRGSNDTIDICNAPNDDGVMVVKSLSLVDSTSLKLSLLTRSDCNLIMHTKREIAEEVTLQYVFSSMIPLALFVVGTI